jgi:hypothetical protein
VVALHAARHRRLGTVALGSSSSPRAPLSSTPLERWCTGRGKIPRRQRTQEQVAADGFYRWRLGFGRARVDRMQHGARGSHLRTPAQQGAAPWAKPGARCAATPVAIPRGSRGRKGNSLPRLTRGPQVAVRVRRGRRLAGWAGL